MKKIILFLILILGSQCFAFDIVYPKKNDVTINSNSTFFIGASKTPLKINSQEVPLHETGAFAYVVDLAEGQNIFTLEAEDDRQIFVITRPKIRPQTQTEVQFKPFEQKPFYVTTENCPLRSTPVDAGINRLAHLQRNILLNIDGEKGGFYRVVLSKDRYAWIAKSDVKECQNYKYSPAEMSGYEFSEDKEFYKYIFNFNKRVPFEIIEENPLRIRFYNVKDSDNEIFEMEFPFQQKLSGYGGKYEDNQFVWTVRKPQQINLHKPLKGLTIAIDAGHGGYENGAIGCLGDKEKDINLSIAKYLETELKKRGAKVVMTRNDDFYLGLKQRVDIANYNNATVLLSIHANALPDGKDPNKFSGTSIYYYYNQAKPLADTILDVMTSELNLNNDNVRQASFALVRNTDALSILIETAYLINPEDNAKLIKPEFQKDCAKAIADGLENYFLKY